MSDAQKQAGEIRGSNNNRLKKVQRGRPVKEVYQPFAQNLLFMIEDMRTQPRETPWPGSEESNPSKSSPGPFDAISAKSRSLAPFLPNSEKSFNAWWDYTLDLLLVLGANPTSSQCSAHAELIRRVVWGDPLAPSTTAKKELLASLPQTLRKRIGSKNPHVASKALREALLRRPYSEIPDQPPGPNPVAQWRANEKAQRTIKDRRIESKRRKLSGREQATRAQAVDAIDNLPDLVRSIADSQRIGIFKKACRKVWPTYWPEVVRMLRDSRIAPSAVSVSNRSIRHE